MSVVCNGGGLCWFRRSLAAQQRARAKEAISQTKSLQSSMSAGKKALQVRLLLVYSCELLYQTRSHLI